MRNLALRTSVIFAIVAVSAWLYFANSDPPKRPFPQMPTAVDPAPQFDKKPESLKELLVVANGPPKKAELEYVGPQACGECHGEELRAMENSQHFRTCRVPDPKTMAPGFVTGDTVKTHYDGVHFFMKREGDKFIQTSITSSGNTESLSTDRIDLVYGAGTADEVFVTWHDDGEMFELPVAWMTTEKKWCVSHFDPHLGGSHSRPLTLRCFECHNTWFEHVPGTLNEYRRDNLIMGVTCESCHGPGKQHIRNHSEIQSEGKSAAVNEAIVHPKQLSRDRQTDLCTQCHSNAITHRDRALQFRPGEKLEDSYLSLHETTFEEDRVANQIAYLKQSKCYQRSDTLTCITCHDPHHELDSKSRLRMCIQCHEPESCGERASLPDEIQDDCIGCHMPQRVKININFETADDDFVPPIRRFDHKIAVNPIGRDEVLLAWHRKQTTDESKSETERLQKALVEYWFDNAEKLRHEYRYMAVIGAYREAHLVDPNPVVKKALKEAVKFQVGLSANWNDAMFVASQNHVPEAIKLVNDYLQIKPNDAKAHGKLGSLYAMLKQSDLAIHHLKESAKLDPDDPYGFGMLGWLAYLDGRHAEALQYYEKAEQIEPHLAKLRYQKGLSLESLRRIPDAEASFQKAVECDPKRTDAYAHLVILMRQEGRVHDALEYAKQAAFETNYENLDVLMMLAETYSLVGSDKEAIAATTIALGIAERENSNARKEIESILQQLKAMNSN